MGVFVLIKEFRFHVGRAMKLTHKWNGTFRVAYQRSAMSFDLEDTDTGRLFSMRLFNMRNIHRQHFDDPLQLLEEALPAMEEKEELTAAQGQQVFRGPKH